MRVLKLAGAIVLGVATAACGATGATPSSIQATDPGQASDPSQTSPEVSGPADPLAVCADVPVEEERFETDIETVSFAFDTEVIEGPRTCQPFTINFTNNDVFEASPQAELTGAHDIDIRADNVLGPVLFDGEAIAGPGGTISYEIPGLPAGEHYFFCSLHTGAMNGTLVVSDE